MREPPEESEHRGQAYVFLNWVEQREAVLEK